MTAQGPNGCTIQLYHLIDHQFSALTDCFYQAESRTLDWDNIHHILYYSATDKNNKVGIHSIQLPAKEIKTVTTPSHLQAQDWSPKISPDGQWLSFSRGHQSVRNIWLKNLSSHEEIALTNNKHYTVSHDWYDSQHLVFDSDMNGSRQLWLINIQDKSPQLLGAYGAQHPSFDQSSDMMTFQEVNYEANIWLFDIQKNRMERIVNSTKYDNNPAFSPDGQRFAFSSNRQDIGSIWVYDFNSNTERQLLSIKEAKLTRPQWSHDGRFLTLTINNKHGYGSLELDTETNQFRPIPIEENHISTTLVGDTYYSLSQSDKNAGRVIQLKQGQQRLLPIDSVSRFMALSNGNLVYTKTSRDGLYLYDQIDSKEHLIVKQFNRNALNLWTVVNNAVYYDQGGEKAGLWRHDIDTGKQELVTEQRPFSVGPALSVNRKENQILITRTDRAESDIFKTRINN